MANDKYMPKTKKEMDAYIRAKEEADEMMAKSAKETAKRLAAQGLTVRAGKVVPIKKSDGKKK